MKTKLYTVLVFAFAGSQLFAQCGQRYKDMIFSNVTKTSDITYSTANGTTLKLDVYQPTGDTASKRPLIILAHGGSFISGSKTDDNVVVTLCNNYAKRGYVTASINYRLASNPLVMLDSSQAIQTVLKAISDGKSAIRFFRKDAATTNTYKIDPNWIFAGGNSAGAVLFMHLIYLDSLGEAPPAFQTIINQNGGFEGNSGNDGYSSELSGVINLAGGLNMPEFIGPGNKPSFNAHGDADYTVPYNCANAQNGATPVRLCGLGALEPRYNMFNIPHVSIVYPGAGHVPWQSSAAKMTEVDTTSANFLYSLMCSSSTSIKEVADLNGVKVFPNPANDVLNITFNDMSRFEKVQLLDATGRMMNEQMVTSANININRNEISSGIYFVRFVMNDGTTAVKKVVFE